MKRHGRRIVVILASLMAGSYLGLAADSSKAFLGAWEYRQRAGDGYDAEGERLELKSKGSAITGLYFGLEREGEHGLYYTLVEIRDAKVEKDRISFTVPARHLFAKRPWSLQEAKKNEPGSRGFTRDELRMTGELKDGALVVTCTSQSHSCPEGVMEFRKNRRH